MHTELLLQSHETMRIINCFISLAGFEYMFISFFNCVYKKGKVIKIYAKLYLSIVVYANDSFLPTKFVKYTQSQYWDLISILTHFDDFGILCTCFALHSLVAPLTAIHTGPSDVITRFLSNALTTGLCAVLSICTTVTFC